MKHTPDPLDNPLDETIELKIRSLKPLADAIKVSYRRGAIALDQLQRAMDNMGESDQNATAPMWFMPPGDSLVSSDSSNNHQDRQSELSPWDGESLRVLVADADALEEK